MAIQKLDRLSKDRSRAALRNDGVVDRECYLADCSAMVKMLTTPETLAEDESMRSNSSTLPRSVATRAPSPPVTLLLIQENAKTYRKGLSIRHLRHQMWERKDGHDDPADGQCKYHDDTNNADPPRLLAVYGQPARAKEHLRAGLSHSSKQRSAPRMPSSWLQHPSPASASAVQKLALAGLDAGEELQGVNGWASYMPFRICRS